MTTQSRPQLAVEGLHKVFDADHQVRAVDGVSFEVEEGAFYTLLGPSGCGKTTTLRCVAGLERATGGRIVVDGKVVSDATTGAFVPPHRRDIGMVFQSYGIWPHMSVFENAAFPLRVAKPRIAKAEISRRVEEALATVQLDGFEGRMATALSGGQQQRLALARALVRRPRLLLLDEPLSNLDAKLREAMRSELSALQRQLGVTTLYVTHDQHEALSMSNRIAVMGEGRIAQEGSPRDIYQRPSTRFVANFVGSTNLLPGRVLSAGPDEVKIKTPVGVVVAPQADGAAADDAVVVSIRPEDVRLHATSGAGPNVIEAQVQQAMFLGEVLDCRVVIGDITLASRQPTTTEVAPGARVWVELPTDRFTVLRDEPATMAAPPGDEPVDRGLPIDVPSPVPTEAAHGSNHSSHV